MGTIGGNYIFTALQAYFRSSNLIFVYIPKNLYYLMPDVPSKSRTFYFLNEKKNVKRMYEMYYKAG